MAKARDAFRTISEVSDWLDTPAHVLRFWESKFTQVKPVKRAGGRRYYRPDDMSLLGGIKVLLHEQGMTIKGAQKLLREQGVKHVAELSPPLHGETPAPAQAAATPAAEPVQAETAMPPPAAAPAPVQDAPAADAAVADNVTPFTAMPPPTAPANSPEPAVQAAPDAAPAPAPAAAAPAAQPTLPLEPKSAPEPRIFAALRDADAARLRAKSAQIAPLVARLQDVRDRMRQS